MVVESQPDGTIALPCASNVEVSIESLVTEHREIEGVLDRFAGDIAGEKIDDEVFRAVWTACIRHYRREEGFLDRLSARDVRLAAKLRGQHDEAMELGERLTEALAGGQTADAMRLARRFAAIVQHNIIEEERDVFPFARGI
jgi:hypothetical protein